MTMVEISGNTYPVKDQIKALGGKWDSERKVWLVPSENAEDARRAVAGKISTKQQAAFDRRRARYAR